MKMDEIEEVQQHNMISNLPLLFANGYPTSLEKITECQLENFIPFMVQCSLGHINLQGKIDFSEPEWWPENVPYTIPFTKPKKFNGNWLEKMKEIVIICYQFHKSVFLLRFCNDLAAYEHASLRFINNYNSTTSLFDRRSNKLLVTFRNENMSYDQPQRSRKCLLQQKSKVNAQQQHMVEPAPFDIYLCDNCDAELYSEEAIVEHEKTCNLDDDVIICDSPEPHEDNQLNLSSNTTENNELRKNFLLNFNLQCRNSNSHKAPSPNTSTKEAKETVASPIEKLKRLPRRNRGVHSLSRCPTIPLSSPAGQLLIKTSKTLMTQDYLMERLDRMERFCYAPILAKGSVRPKFLEKKYSTPVSHCTFKKPQDYTIHTYIFPRRQFSQRKRTENFMFLNSLLIKRCRPISVRLRKITESEIVKRKRAIQSNKLNIKLTRDTSRSSNWKISSPSAEIIVDTIDLCSSDDDDGDRHSQLTDDTADSSCSGSPATFTPSVIKFQLQKLAHRLNSEVTLTPIPREPTNGSLRHSLSINPAKIQVAPATSTTNPKGGLITFQRLPPKQEEAKPLSFNHYEGNILLSPTQNGTVSPATKPLQPSVFIFSNYTANPITLNSFLTSATGSPSPSPHNNNNDLIVTSSYQNEENLHESSARKNPSVAEWYPSSIAASNNSISSTHNNSSNGGSKTVAVNGRNTRSLPLMPFSSSQRVVSIDLTS